MTLLLVHAGATLAMTGVIWFVQLVHYPLFPYAAEGDFRAFAADHQRRTSWVVVPLMLTEAVTATLLVLSDIKSFDPAQPLAWLGWVLLVSIWISTALVQVPLHGRLSERFDPQAARRLVTTNWFRTVAWTARAILAIQLLGGAP